MLEELLPFPLRGIDVDNDGAFLNVPLEQWCEKHHPPIALTRSRAYQSNDQAWVEQKNGMLIRRVVGYQRLEGLVAAELLGELYGALRLFTNLYQPSFKLKETIREGAKLKRRHHPPRTPQQRLLALGKLRDTQRKALEELLSAAIRSPCWKRFVAARLPWPASRPGWNIRSRDPGQGRWILSRPARGPFVVEVPEPLWHGSPV
jgi:hypothetical protein